MEENNNMDESILNAHITEQLEAAGQQAAAAAAGSVHVMTEGFDYDVVEKNTTKKEIIEGYLLQEWTWLTTLQDKFDNDEDVPAPDHCEHVDPMNPTVWVGMLSVPNTLFCMECAIERADKDIQTGLELCDRCHTTNESGEFYEFLMPIVNIQLMGSICKGCLDKV